MTGNVRRIAATALVLGAACALAGCAAGGPEEKARATAESFAEAFTERDARAVEELACGGAVLGYSAAPEGTDITGHTLGTVKQVNGDYEVPVTFQVDDTLKWEATVRVTVADDSACVAQVLDGTS